MGKTKRYLSYDQAITLHSRVQHHVSEMNGNTSLDLLMNRLEEDNDLDFQFAESAVIQRLKAIGQWERFRRRKSHPESGLADRVAALEGRMSALEEALGIDNSNH